MENEPIRSRLTKLGHVGTAAAGVQPFSRQPTTDVYSHHLYKIWMQKIRAVCATAKGSAHR